MKSLPSIAFFLFAVILIAVGLFLIAQSDEAVAAKDTCYDAVLALYSNCDLKLVVNGGELGSVNEAVNFCRNQSDVGLRACWTNCALDNPNCGLMASCIDECFEGETNCGFMMEFIYEICSIALVNPLDYEEVIDKDTALAGCNQAGQAWDPFYECFTQCAYENYTACDQMSPCLAECYDLSPGDDDNDDTGDDDTVEPTPEEESPNESEGEDLDEEGGSACGF